MILMPQIFDVTANENARYKRNELELHFHDIVLTHDLVGELHLATKFDLFNDFQDIFIEHFQSMWHVDSRFLLLLTSGPVLFKTCICFNIGTTSILSKLFHIFGHNFIFHFKQVECDC